MLTSEAYEIIKRTKSDFTTLRQRLEAHNVILMYGAPSVGEIAKQELMAEALSDISLALSKLV